MAHKHTCLNCDVVIAEGDFDCELDRDHDFELCDNCIQVQTEFQVIVRQFGENSTCVGTYATYAEAEAAGSRYRHEKNSVYPIDIEIKAVSVDLYGKREGP